VEQHRTPRQAIAVTLHELATNAAKYGSLSVARGQVEVTWSLTLNGRRILHWTESGGPAVKKPTRQGFGTSVIERMTEDNQTVKCTSSGAQKVWRVNLSLKCNGSELVKTQHPAHCGGGILGETFQVGILASGSG